MPNPNDLKTVEEKAKYVWDTADFVLEEEVDAAYIFSVLKKTCHEFPVFQDAELTTGQLLGRGGFSNVYEIQRIDLDDDKNHINDSNNDNIEQHTVAKAKDQFDDDDKEQNQDHKHYDLENARHTMKRRVVRRLDNRDGDVNYYCRYALKRLRPDLKNEVNYARGAIDLAIAIKYLSVLVHPNIIKMRATNGNTNGNNTRVSRDTFIVMDRLYGTLEDKMEYDWWIANKNITEAASRKYRISRISSSSGVSSLGCCEFLFGAAGTRRMKNKAKESNAVMRMRANYERERTDFLKQRVLVAYDLTAAFEYMHDFRLVYRDIKPQNIGFDIRGDVKVFDFGLMKSMNDNLKAAGEYGYNLTGFTGSIPHMAPEIALRKPYGKEVDVFSFSMLLWEIISLEFLYPEYSVKDYYERVCKGKERPSFANMDDSYQDSTTDSTSWSSVPGAVLKTIVTEGWNHIPQQRPTMKRIGSLLRGVLNDLAEELQTSAADTVGKASTSGANSSHLILDDDYSAIKYRSEHMRNRSNNSIQFDSCLVVGAPRTGGGGCRSTTIRFRSPKQISKAGDNNNPATKVPSRDRNKNKDNSGSNNSNNDDIQRISTLTKYRGESVHRYDSTTL